MFRFSAFQGAVRRNNLILFASKKLKTRLKIFIQGETLCGITDAVAVALTDVALLFCFCSYAVAEIITVVATKRAVIAVILSFGISYFLAFVAHLTVVAVNNKTKYIKIKKGVAEMSLLFFV